MDFATYRQKFVDRHLHPLLNLNHTLAVLPKNPLLANGPNDSYLSGLLF